MPLLWVLHVPPNMQGALPENQARSLHPGLLPHMDVRTQAQPGRNPAFPHEALLCRASQPLRTIRDAGVAARTGPHLLRRGCPALPVMEPAEEPSYPERSTKPSPHPGQEVAPLAAALGDRGWDFAGPESPSWFCHFEQSDFGQVLHLLLPGKRDPSLLAVLRNQCQCVGTGTGTERA